MKIKNHYKAVVVGGGIVGAGIFRDLALNGVEVLLVDAGDFSSQTSERSSKMLHGGIRYLENMDFSLVHEALHEKNLWLKLTPDLSREVPFYLPVYRNAKRPLWMIKIGLFLYDFLSGFKNSPHLMKSKAECLKDIEGLNPEGLVGAGVYADGIMDDAKLALEVVYDGLVEECAHVLNYTQVIDVTKKDQSTMLSLKDTLTGEKKTISADQVVYALGPFTDTFLSRFPFYHWKNVLLPSKGSHIWVKSSALPLQYPIVMTPRDEFGDRVIFVIPQGEKVLVGTTEVPSDPDLFHVTPSEEEVSYLLKNLNSYFPQLHITSEHVVGRFAGIRPLVRESDASADRGKTSREHKIFQPDSHTYVIVGGKYTTFRVMGQDITRTICERFGRSFNPHRTESPLRRRSIVLPFSWKLPTADELVNICENERPKTFCDLVVRRLSVATREIWKEKTREDFDQYFARHLPILQKYLQMNPEDIKNFK